MPAAGSRVPFGADIDVFDEDLVGLRSERHLEPGYEQEDGQRINRERSLGVVERVGWTHEQELSEHGADGTDFEQAAEMLRMESAMGSASVVSLDSAQAQTQAQAQAHAYAYTPSQALFTGAPGPAAASPAEAVPGTDGGDRPVLQWDDGAFRPSERAENVEDPEDADIANSQIGAAGNDDESEENEYDILATVSEDPQGHAEVIQAALSHLAALHHDALIARRESGLPRFANLSVEPLAGAHASRAPPGSDAEKLATAALMGVSRCKCFELQQKLQPPEQEIANRPQSHGSASGGNREEGDGRAPAGFREDHGEDEDRDDEEYDYDDETPEDERRRIALRIHQVSCTARPLLETEVHVRWADNTESIQDVSTIEAIDRAFLFGDVVVRRSDQEGQMGTVIDVKERLDLRFYELDKDDGREHDGSGDGNANGGKPPLQQGGKQHGLGGTSEDDDDAWEDRRPIIRGVSSFLVRPVVRAMQESIVTSNWWVGQAMEVICGITIEFEDGSRGTLDTPIFPDEAEDSLDENLEQGDEVMCYPGQQLSVSSAGLARIEWIDGSRGPHTARRNLYGVPQKYRGKVVSIAAKLADVAWRGTKNLFLDDPEEPPFEATRAEDLNVLNYARSVTWQLGERCIVFEDVRDEGMLDAVPPADNPITVAALESGSLAHIETAESVSRHVAEVIRTSTAVSVRWQDGTVEDFRALDLCPADSHLLEDELSPEDLVVPRRSPDDGSHDERLQRVGFVEKVDSTARTARVTWLHFDSSSGVEGSSYSYDPDTCVTEEIPIFEVELHPEFRFSLVSVVARIQREPPALSGATPTSQVGEVVDVRCGRVYVLWADGSQSWCGPDELLSFEGMLEEGDGEESEEEEESGLEESDEVIEQDDQYALVEEGLRAAQQIANEISGVVPLHGHAAHNLNGGPTPAVVSTSAEASAAAQSALQTTQSTVEALSRVARAIAEAAAAANRGADLTVGRQTDAQPDARYPAFASIEEDEHASALAADHKFFREPSPENMGSFAAVIMREFDVLQKDLPYGVWVRVFEERPWLMHALILGPAGTPYHDVPFAFDIYLPPEYPNAPPSCHFRNVNAERMHPNLYENGKVCLSLLGTWHARDAAEVWNPQRSNILQLVLSIQGLILGVSDPYYLEAGYEKYRGARQAATASGHYNESVSLMAVKMIPQMIRHPEKVGTCFAGIIRMHFQRRGDALVSRLSAYCEESEAGKEEAPDSPASSSSELRDNFFENPSAGFRMALRRLLPSLRDAISIAQRDGSASEDGTHDASASERA